ncbi:Fur family transcriptional regulator [Arenibacter certesii]|uniref:Transcriptional regulator n=1 Tax=Arenibacter certesii TaxID=228955 RepID=A0A918INR9_9FLAO|nr:transcriptional repressor [Arenibacter certesii]GGW21673.1 transcriptional regulator [Arenibacter certesii]
MKNSEKQLRDSGIRPTAMRILVHQFMQDQSSAVSLTAVEDNFERSDRTTLYRTLKTFEDKCLVHQIDDGTGIPKYALCKHDAVEGKHGDLHLHFHCTQCNQTTCLTEHRIPTISLPDGFVPEDINMLVKGICDNCNL